MMHHSLHRRDLLRKMNSHPLIVARRNPHRNVARRHKLETSANDLLLDGAWAIQSARNHVVEKLVADDTADFLKCMGVQIDPASDRRILLEIGSCPAGFRTVVDANRIEVHAADASSLWAGWVHLEHAMRRAGGPALEKGEQKRQPAWEVQISPPTWGTNYAVPDLSPDFISDETFKALAHQGADAMLIYGDFLVYATGTDFTELHHPEAPKHLDLLRDATNRAANYGVKLYYCAVGPKLLEDHALFKRLPQSRGAKLAWGQKQLHCLCSSDPQSLAFHGQVLGNIFQHAPQLAGLILIIGGESYYHCFMRAQGAAVGETNCPRCKGKRAEDVIASLLRTTAEAVHEHAPSAKLTAWPYSAQFFWSKDVNELDMIDRLPSAVGFLSEIDKDELLQKDGYQKLIWDYSVEAERASQRITTQGQRCRERNRNLFVKCETSNGIELLHLPYVPSITRSARMWSSMRKLDPTGVLQRWGFIGMFDSAAERIAFKARWNDSFDPLTASKDVAKELVGDHAEEVLRAWQKFDEAVAHIPILTTGAYYIGPAFLGPAHPLPVWQGDTPDAFRGDLFYLAEERATFEPPPARRSDDLTLHSIAQLGNAVPIDIVQREFTRARDLSREGHEILSALKGDDAELREQQSIGEYLYQTFEATVNTIHFLREREGANNPARLREIAASELENARAAKRLYESTPWMNHALRLDVGCPDSLVMVNEKIRLLEKFI